MENFSHTSNHIDHNTLMTNDGDYLRVWKVNDINEGAELELDFIKRQLKQSSPLLKSPNNIAIWTHQVKSQVFDQSCVTFDSTFCQNNQNHMAANELYLTLLYRPFLPERVQEEALEKLEELSCEIELSLEDYELEEIGVYEDEQNVVCSKLLECLNYLTLGEKKKLPLAGN